MIELRRGSVVLYGERGEYTSKPQPSVVLQRDSTLPASPSVTLCGITKFVVPANGVRVPVYPDPSNGLQHMSFVMIDKLVSISRPRVREVIGIFDSETMTAIDIALRRWLGL